MPALLDIFACSHIFPFQQIDAKPSVGYFYPPTYAFLPAGTQKEDPSGLIWTYTLWHEMQHVTQPGYNSLEIYETVLEVLSENLAIYGFSLFSKGKSEGLNYIHKSIELLEKRKLLNEISSIAREVIPTFSQLNPKTYDAVTDSIYNLIPPIFVKPGKSTVSRFVKKSGESFLKEISMPLNERKRSITKEHELAYVYGKRLYEEARDSNEVADRLAWCMNIGFDINPIDSSLEEMRSAINGDKRARYPDERLRMIAEGKIPLEEAKAPDSAEAKSGFNEMLRMFSRPTVPSEIGAPLAEAMNAAFERGERIFGLQGQQNFTSSTGGFALTRTEYGDIFVQVATQLTGKGSKTYFQGMLSDSYAFELILRLSGYRRYPDDFLCAIRAATYSLTPRVYDPNLHYFDVERWIKGNLSIEEAKGILAPVTWG